ncbi:hypothetical protein LOZ61_000802 [Ophidiomyces ophidiicola]|uniref:Uncharacterized protein n=1 Tax=Ophidiomyces ophidiicola TaxID=1387563 RepID=A0ACB8UQM6_9EURO|nr:hypothetical protein LOZ64_005699 [Ophidiomyces ophidiicola]KAI1916899.1 hypothetical protein LOZ61_000802 [Ophidiomyces ophidiicola]KAI1922505.1 hypothetical protein LOZ60_005622 [Ophidiomyces ophidiicola]KAI1951555.1 hypothetical protein LOZ59_005591 [Ophidiomyces ophidiicola]KAI1968913.1 hypothetical protein LOZ56_004722 [Ophidiomyces ophidiicola]
MASATSTDGTDGSVAKGDNGLFTEPYRALNRAFHFSDENQAGWWRATGPIFAKFLHDGGYDVGRQFEYLAFIREHLYPHLGPALGTRRVFPNPSTGDPDFELSMNFQKSKSTARICFLPVVRVPVADGEDDYLPSATPILKTLKPALNHFGYSTTLYDAMKPHLEASDEERDVLREKGFIKAKLFELQTTMAFDFRHEGPLVAKVYMFPTLKSQVTGTPESQLLLGAARAADPTGQVFPALSLVEEYFATSVGKGFGDTSCTAAPWSISFDMLEPKQSRIKIYAIELQVDMDRLEAHWTMGGRLNEPGHLKGLEHAKDLFRRLQIPEGRRQMANDYPHFKDPTTLNPLVVNWELQPGNPIPKPKVYFSLRGLSDTDNAAAITGFFSSLGWKDHAENYTRNLRSYL